MAIGKTNAGAGGSGGVNFRVVGGLTQPTSPKENTIWVKTDIEIPCWTTASSNKAPAYVAPKGTVTFWWESATSGEVSGTTAAGFMPIKYKATNPPGNMRLKPINCYQNQDGTKTGWKSMEAYIYKGGTWVQFSNGGYLYDQGNLCIYYGGNWLTAGVGMNADAPSPKAPGFSNGTTSATITQEATKGGIVYKDNKVDLTDATQLVFAGNSSVSSEGHKMAIAVWSTLPTPGQYWAENRLAKADFGNTQGAVSASLDVSALSGEYYVGICIYGIRTLEMDTMQLVV